MSLATKRHKKHKRHKTKRRTQESANTTCKAVNLTLGSISLVPLELFAPFVANRATILSPSVNLAARFHKFAGFFFQSDIQRRLGFDLFLRSVLADVLRDLHRTEMWTTHRAEVRQLRAFLRQGLVVILTRDFRIE